MSGNKYLLRYINNRFKDKVYIWCNTKTNVQSKTSIYKTLCNIQIQEIQQLDRAFNDYIFQTD